MTYSAPIRSLSQALNFAFSTTRSGTEAGSISDDTTREAVLKGAAALAEGVFAPLNRSGDIEGSCMTNGDVVTASGFKDAYRAFADGGWNGLSADFDVGGHGLDGALGLAAFEIFHGANLALSLCPLLTQGAIELLSRFGSAAHRTVVLPKLVSGAWTGTMNLTEPQAGSDLSDIRCTARSNNGAFVLSGQKIFISWGDHGIAENILHLVLARLPDGPRGVKGLSLFLVPKFLYDESGALLQRNGVHTVSLEHKMGIRGSPTCVMSFDNAKGELVGEPGAGLAQMFVMMKAARLQVAAQGVAIAERAFRQAHTYAQERRQGRSPWSEAQPARLADHPDVRRMLATMRALTEAGRAIYLLASAQSDIARNEGAGPGQGNASKRGDLLIPIAKAWCTDIGCEVASLGVQVHGGAGFIEETGAAQHLRDARILPIYEGTNGIQAIDLVSRRVVSDGGAEVRCLAGDIRSSIARIPHDSPAARLREPIEAALSMWEVATDIVVAAEAVDALACAVPYLRLSGDILGAWALLTYAQQPADDAWSSNLLPLAEIFMTHVMSRAHSHLAAIEQGSSALAALDMEVL